VRKIQSNSNKLLLILVATLCINSFGCNATNESMSAAPPKRPANVPKEAIWSGGKDGGVFICITKSKDAPDNIYNAEIYFDTNGEVWYKGRLLLEPSENQNIDSKDKNAYAGWDGDTLYLRDGRTLKALDAIK
jgi:hypothetical protein